MSRFRKHYSHILEDLFLAGKASWTQSRCLPTKSADYLHARVGVVKVMSLLTKPESALRFS